MTKPYKIAAAIASSASDLHNTTYVSSLKNKAEKITELAISMVAKLFKSETGGWTRYFNSI